MARRSGTVFAKVFRADETRFHRFSNKLQWRRRAGIPLCGIPAPPGIVDSGGRLSLFERKTRRMPGVTGEGRVFRPPEKPARHAFCFRHGDCRPLNSCDNPIAIRMPVQKACRLQKPVPDRNIPRRRLRSSVVAGGFPYSGASERSLERFGGCPSDRLRDLL